MPQTRPLSVIRAIPDHVQHRLTVEQMARRTQQPEPVLRDRRAEASDPPHHCSILLRPAMLGAVPVDVIELEILRRTARHAGAAVYFEGTRAGHAIPFRPTRDIACTTAARTTAEVLKRLYRRAVRTPPQAIRTQITGNVASYVATHWSVDLACVRLSPLGVVALTAPRSVAGRLARITHELAQWLLGIAATANLQHASLPAGRSSGFGDHLPGMVAFRMFGEAWRHDFCTGTPLFRPYSTAPTVNCDALTSAFCRTWPSAEIRRGGIGGRCPDGPPSRWTLRSWATCR
jgi:hypothetical protein